MTNEQTARSFDMKACFEMLTEYLHQATGEYPDTYSYNYSRKVWRSLSSFHEHIKDISNSDLVFCYANNQKNSGTFFISNQMMNSDPLPLLAPVEIDCYLNAGTFNLQEFIKMLSDLSKLVRIDYGYCLEMKEGDDLMKEERKGQRVSASKSESFLWRGKLQNVTTGYIKRIYPINFINSCQMESLKVREMQLGKLSQIDKNLYCWILGEKELELCKEKYAFSEYVYFH